MRLRGDRHSARRMAIGTRRRDASAGIQGGVIGHSAHLLVIDDYLKNIEEGAQRNHSPKNLPDVSVNEQHPLDPSTARS